MLLHYSKEILKITVNAGNCPKNQFISLLFLMDFVLSLNRLLGFFKTYFTETAVRRRYKK